jgi:hypothetical protein
LESSMVEVKVSGVNQEKYSIEVKVKEVKVK